MFTDRMDNGGTVMYVERDDWGGGPIRKGHVVPESQFVGLAVHHTVAVMADYDRDGYLHGDLDDVVRYMRQLQVARPDLGSEVPYSWPIFEAADAGDCIVCVGRGPGRTGAHTKGYNSSRYGVAIAGNTMLRTPTPGMVAAIRWIGRKFIHEPANAFATFGHRDVAQTACPGDGMYGLLPKVQPPYIIAAPPAPVPQEDDMPRLIKAPDGKVYASDGIYKRELTGPQAGEYRQTFGCPAPVAVSGDLLGRLITAED